MVQKNPIITAEDVRMFLHIQGDTDDALIGRLIDKAQRAAEEYCRTRFSEDASEAVKCAALLMVRYDFENRDRMDHQTYNKMRGAFESLLYPYRNIEGSFESQDGARAVCAQAVRAQAVYKPAVRA